MKKKIFAEKVPNLKEKELLIAHYFCEKSRKELTPTEVYDMWRNWFSSDFKMDGESIFKIENDKLVFRKKSCSKDYEKERNILKKIFDFSYLWIKKSVENQANSKQHFKNELDRERRKGFAKILTLAKPLGLYVTLSNKDLYKNKLGYYQIIKDNHIITAGNSDKIIEYLRTMKKEST